MPGRLFRSLPALAALTWAAYFTARFALSGLDTAGSDGFSGAAEALDTIYVVIGAAAGAFAATVVIAPAARHAVAALVIAAAVVVGAGLSIVSGQLGDVSWAALLLAWCWSTGNAGLRRLQIDSFAVEGWARGVLATGLGLGLLSFVVLALSLLGLLTGFGIVLVLAMGTLTLPGSLGSRRNAAPARGRESASSVEQAALIAVTAAALVGFAVCLTPQVNFDALHYHFAMPDALLRAASFVERPDIIQSYFPLGLEMVYAPAFWLAGETAANLLHWIYLPLTAALLWSAGDRWCGRPAGALAATLYALSPLVVWEGTSASSDLAMTFYLVAAVYLISVRAERRIEAPAGELVAAGLSAGLAISFKLASGIYMAPVAVAFVAALLLRRPASEAAGPRERRNKGAGVLRSTGWFALGGLVTGSPWLLLRWLQTGNPVFPLYNAVFRSAMWPAVNERFDLPFFGIGTSLGDFMSFWWQATMEPSRFGQQAAPWFIGAPLILSLAALLLLPRLHSRGGRVWALAAFAAVVAWFLLSQYHRYGQPAFALLCLPAAFGVVTAARLLPRARPTTSPLLTGLVGTWFVAGMVVAFASFSLIPGHFPADVLLGRVSRDEYRSRWVPNYDAISFFDRATRGSDDAGAILGFPYNYYASNRLYDVIVPAELSPFRRIVEAALPPEETARQLDNAGVRWFVYDGNNPFDYDEWPPAWLAESVLAPSIVETYWQVAFSENGVTVYRLRPP